MSIRKSPVLLAVAAACGLAPLGAQAAPSVSFKAPLAGATVSGTLSGTACEAIASSSGPAVKRVRFFVGSTAVGNSDYGAPYRCTLDTTQLANGSHQLVAKAYDTAGAMGSKTISINVQNGTGGGGTPAPTAGPLDVWFKAPADGATVSGTLGGGTNCYVKGVGVTKVQFFVNATPVGTDTTMADGMQCQFDTTQFTNGTHQFKVKAWDATGATRLDVISINVQNSGDPDPDPTGGLNAVSTFHSIGLYWKPPSNPGSAGCPVTFRKQGDSAWRNGLNLWYDSRNNECRGSLVELEPGATYEIQAGMPGQSPAASKTAKTWSEQFPVAQVITLPANSSQPLKITQGGTASGYIVYQAAAGGSTIDVDNAYANGVTIAAPYVIVRGLTVKGAKQDAIALLAGAHDVVIEENDISGWGRFNYTNSSGWKIGVDYDAGVRCEGVASLERVVIQRNKIHDPRYGANSWDWGHPAGPQGVTFNFCGGNNVIRYNEITSADNQHYFNDGIGGSDNFTKTGFPNYDSDIYGNLIQGVMDDAIEAEGGNRNVRIWGNYLDQTGTGVATTVAALGPLYVFRNVYNRSRMRYLSALDSDDRGPFFKSGSQDSNIGGGRRYVFHNTALQSTGSGASNGLGAGSGLQGQGCNEALTNTVSRNNIYQVWKSSWGSIEQTSCGTGNDADYDLYNGSISANQGAQAHGIKAAASYKSGNGPASGSGGMYQLQAGSAGQGKGVRLNNFNDAYATPDMGAHQSGAPAMKFGVNAQ